MLVEEHSGAATKAATSAPADAGTKPGSAEVVRAGRCRPTLRDIWEDNNAGILLYLISGIIMPLEDHA
jgi:hypothetical protein